MRRFYFTSESHCDGDNPANDHCGNIRGARTIAQKVANEIGETVYINDCETNDIVDCIEPDSILDEVPETVENKTILTPLEIAHLQTLLQNEITEKKRSIKFLKNNSSSTSFDLISGHTKAIENDKIILDKLTSLFYLYQFWRY